jgi:SpoVK/Ycf46/Vps4 family AAA+-type ATPase
MSELSKGAKSAADVAALLRARNPLIVIGTREEARVERLLMAAFQTAQYEPRFWDCANGITDYSGEAVDGGSQVTDCSQVINKIQTSRRRQVWVLRDLAPWLRDPSVCRGLRSLVRALPMVEREQGRAVILLQPTTEIPPELQGHAIVIDWPLPDRSEVAEILDAAIRALPDDMKASAAPNGARDAAIDAAVGLTGEEAQSCYAKSLVTTRRIDPAAVAGEKKRVVQSAKGIEWIDPLPLGRDAVGGLENVWQWCDSRGLAYSAAARAYGLPAPRGVLLVGQSGCGKSLLAKAIPTAWGIPCLRLDMGALKSKWVGESEGNLRQAFKLIEAIGRCCVWLDEIEKAFTGASQGAADGGVSADAMGAFLTWREETKSPAFLIATANNVEGLAQSNPEFFRRFDETFFVDVPSPEDRASILRAALLKHGRGALKLDLAGTVAASEGFTGAELAGLIPSAMFAAFADGQREISAADLEAAARVVVPLSRTAGEKFDKLRAWAKGRARPASITSNTPASSGRTLDI